MTVIKIVVVVRERSVCCRAFVDLFVLLLTKNDYIRTRFSCEILCGEHFENLENPSPIDILSHFLHSQAPKSLNTDVVYRPLESVVSSNPIFC
jgi:hypothetical protein